MSESENERRRVAMVNKMLRLEDKRKKMSKEIDKLDSEIYQVKDDIYRGKYIRRK